MAAVKTELLPAELVVAVLYWVGKDVALEDDFRLAKSFDKVAKERGGIFKQFKSHPRHHYSRLLTEVLQSLDYGGSITRKNFDSLQFSATEHTAGPYGKSLFDRLDEDDKEVAKSLANAITRAFTENG